MQAIDLTAVPVGPTEFGQWAGLNGPLGLGAFGINVVEAAPDERLESAHDEIESAQEELFVVVSGRARFVVGDETIDAGPGMAIGVGDPAVKRGYQALEPGTRVLCIGAQVAAGATNWGYWIT